MQSHYMLNFLYWPCFQSTVRCPYQNASCSTSALQAVKNFPFWVCQDLLGLRRTLPVYISQSQEGKFNQSQNCLWLEKNPLKMKKHLIFVTATLFIGIAHSLIAQGIYLYKSIFSIIKITISLQRNSNLLRSEPRICLILFVEHY